MLTVSPVSFAAEKETPRTDQNRRFWLLALPAATLAFGLLVAGTLILSRSISPRVLRPIQFTISPPQGFAFQPSGSRQSFAISPDGTRLAFVTLADDGLFRLWIRDLARLAPREIPAAKGLHTLFWSPDGDFLYFGMDRSLRRISPEPSAAPQIITDLAWRVPAIGEWLNPDRLLLSNRQVSVTVSPTGGRATAVADRYLWPQMLPDGQHLLYLTYDAISRFTAFDC